MIISSVADPDPNPDPDQPDPHVFGPRESRSDFICQRSGPLSPALDPPISKQK
jgi:hypothetical protein